MDELLKALDNRFDPVPWRYRIQAMTLLVEMAAEIKRLESAQKLCFACGAELDRCTAKMGSLV